MVWKAGIRSRSRSRSRIYAGLEVILKALVDRGIGLMPNGHSFESNPDVDGQGDQRPTLQLGWVGIWPWTLRFEPKLDSISIKTFFPNECARYLHARWQEPSLTWRVLQSTQNSFGMILANVSLQGTPSVNVASGMIDVSCTQRTVHTLHSSPNG